MRDRITDAQVWAEYTRVAELLVEACGSTDFMPTLHPGNHAYKISNKLILDRVQLWYDNMAGITKRDCYNALRIMSSTLSQVLDSRKIRVQSEAAASKVDNDWEKVDEKMYLVGACGEAFDDLTIAADHLDHCHVCQDSGGTVHIVPESEAF